MSGHSKWSTIKRKKAATDAKRSKVFTKLLKEIQVAAKMGGAQLDGNPRLKAAVQSARSMSLPMENIERAIKKASGESGEANFEEIFYEGYGPGAVAVIVKVLTDNRNRSVADVRHAFTRFHGSMGSSNSVSFQFEERGTIYIPKSIDEETVMTQALEAGALDIQDSGEVWEVTTSPKEYLKVRESLSTLSEEIDGEVGMVPLTTVALPADAVESFQKFLETLEDLDDVQSVFTNVDEGSLPAD